MGRRREGVSKKGEGVGRKGNVWFSLQAFPSVASPLPLLLILPLFAVLLPFASVWKRKGNGCYAG